jgi:hypothetical protein
MIQLAGMNMKTHLLLIILFLLNSHANAQSKCPEKIIVMTSQLPPLTLLKDGIIQGEVTETVNVLLNNHHLTSEITVLNWARLLKSAEKGLTEAIYPTLYSEEREKYLDYSLPAIGKVRLSLYHLNNEKNVNSTFNSELKLDKNTKIATLRSISLKNSGINHTKIFRVTNFEQAFKMLEHQRVDFVYGIQEITEHYLFVNQIKNISLAKTISEKPIFLALSKSSNKYLKLSQCILNKKD